MTAAWPAVLAAVVVVAVGASLRPRPTRAVSRVGPPPGRAIPGAATPVGPTPPAATGRSGGRRADRGPTRLPWSRRTRTSGPADVARWCDDVARAVRSGHGLRVALLAPERDPGTTLGRATERMTLMLDRGVDPARALRRVGEELPPDDPIGTALLVASVAGRLGGPLADPLDRVAAALRARAADEAERSAHSAQARLSAHVLTAVPAGFLTLMVGLDPEVREVVTTVPGAPIVGVGVVLDLVGGWWMRRIVRGGRV